MLSAQWQVSWPSGIIFRICTLTHMCMPLWKLRITAERVAAHVVSSCDVADGDFREVCASLNLRTCMHALPSSGQLGARLPTSNVRRTYAVSCYLGPRCSLDSTYCSPTFRIGSHIFTSLVIFCCRCHSSLCAAIRIVSRYGASHDVHDERHDIQPGPHRRTLAQLGLPTN
jgi:hypothetical protein